MIQASDLSGRLGGAVLGLSRAAVQIKRTIYTSVCLLGVRVSSVRMNRGGEGVAGAVPTVIAIGPPPSEKIPKVRTLRKNA